MVRKFRRRLLSDNRSARAAPGPSGLAERFRMGLPPLGPAPASTPPAREAYLPQPILDHPLRPSRGALRIPPDPQRPNAPEPSHTSRQTRGARHRGRTWELAVFKRAVARLGQESPDRAPEQRFRQVLEHYRRRLGPTQWEHLTTHCVDVAELATLLGRVLALGAAELERLRVAGLLHDIGKLLIPEHVLAKPARLSIEECCLIDRHSEDGATMGTLLGVDRRTAEFIRYHHTHYDPTARPGPRRARAIPLGACILAAADAFVTMTSQRPYQAAQSVPLALEELRRCSGGQFDPLVVAAFTQAVRKPAKLSAATACC